MNKTLSTVRNSDLLDVFDLWDNLFPLRLWDSGSSYPRLNVIEDDKSLVVEASVPGLTKDNVSVTYSDGLLTVSGEKQVSKDDKSAKVHVRELHKSRFVRSVAVSPDHFDVDGVSGKVENGLLTVLVPKKQNVKDNGMRKITLS